MAITVQQRPARLTWDHFIEVDALPDDDGGGELAQIRPETDFPQNMPIVPEGGTLRLGDFVLPIVRIRARTAVLRSAAKTDALRNHEQGHFDLFFLAMRALARDLEAIRASGPSELSSQMQEKRNLHHTRAETIDTAYDRETDHGRDQDAQTRWDEAIAAGKRDGRPTQIFSFPL